MHIYFYHSTLCPRCRRARSHLHDLLGSKAAAAITEIDILRQPGKLKRDGIRMIPALRIDNDICSGIYLTRKRIASFLEEHALPDTTAI